MRTATKYGWQLVSDVNCLALDERSDAIAVASNGAQVVLLQEVTLERLRALFESFVTELRAALYDALSKTPEEFAKWHTAREQGNYQFSEECAPSGCCVGFKRPTLASSKFHFVRHKAVMSAATRTQLLPSTTVTRRPRQTMVRLEAFGGSLVDFCQRLTLEQQRELLRSIFYACDADLDEIIYLGQANVIDLGDVRLMFSRSTSAATVLDQLVDRLSRFESHQPTSWGAGSGLRFGPVWFLMYLAREGLILLPPLGEGLVPRFLRPLLWTFFVAPQCRALAAHIAKHADERDETYIWSVFRELLLTTSFFQRAEFLPSMPELLYLKEVYSGPKATTSARSRGKTNKLHGLNLCTRYYLSFFNRTAEDMGDTAQYFGGGRRLSHTDAREAFGWVTHPWLRKSKLFTKLTAQQQPRRFPEQLVAWAEDLRQLLPLFEVKTLSNKVIGLNHWLCYLATLGDEAPRSWTEVDRERHINSFGRSNTVTFVDFLKRTTSNVRVNSYLADLRQAWLLAAVRDGFEGKLACPIDLEFDRPNGNTYTRNYGTKRRALDLDVYNILLEELRKDDFAFARSLGLYSRRVRDPATGNQLEVFWPAVPFILENILVYGMRLASASWLDSGEGDEHLVDPESLEPVPNRMASSRKGRQFSFLRACRIGPRPNDQVLGIFIAHNKTGAYQVPFSDPDTVAHFLQMRDLQILYNPLRNPVKASNDNLAKQYGKKNLLTEVFPVYRDPTSWAARPPTSGVIHYFWTALLTHCQPIVNAKLGRVRPEDVIHLVINGKSCWDIHSLRVTTISILLDYGVDPCIVAELVGHKSIMMTWHYKDRHASKVYRALLDAFNRRTRDLVSAIKNATSKEQLDELLKRALGELFSLRPDNVGLETLKSLAFGQPGPRYELFAHGLCPGGDCKTGGKLYKNAYQPVWRERACSECRYRITGPAFLPGLVHRLNGLMIEIKSSLDKEAELNAITEQCEADGRSPLRFRELAAGERERRDNLFAEWCAELQTIRSCIGLEEGTNGSSSLPLVIGLTAEEWTMQTETVHQLVLMHSVLKDAQLITGAVYEVPTGLRERRDEILLEIARLNDITPFFYNLSPGRRRRALDAFGDVLCAHAPDDSVIQRLIDGSQKLSELPALETALQGLVGRQPTSTQNANDRVLDRVVI